MSCAYCPATAVLCASVGAYELACCEFHSEDAWASARRYGQVVTFMWLRPRLSFGMRAE